jgi:hypothetical protein
MKFREYLEENKEYDYLEESLKSAFQKSVNIGLMMLMITGGIAGLDYANSRAQRALKNNHQVELSVKSPLISKTPFARETYKLNVDFEQKEPIKVNVEKGEVTINTTDVGNVKLKRMVRNALDDIDGGLAMQNIMSTRINVIK